MRSRIVSLLLAAVISTSVTLGQSPAKLPVVDPSLTRSMDEVLKDVSSIQSGMSLESCCAVLRGIGLYTRDGQQFIVPALHLHQGHREFS